MNERNIESGGSYVVNGGVIELAIGNFFFFFFLSRSKQQCQRIGETKDVDVGLDLYFINNKDAMNERVTTALPYVTNRGR